MVGIKMLIKEFLFEYINIISYSAMIFLLLLFIYSSIKLKIQNKKIQETNSKCIIAATAFESQVGIMVTDINNNIININKKFTEITGYTPYEIIGKTPKILRSNFHDKHFYETMWNNINESGIWAGEIYNLRKNGEIYPEHLTITSIKDNAGNITNYVGTITDITEYKQLENMNKKSLELIKKVASQVPGVVYQYRLTKDGASSFPFASDGIRQIYRLSPEEVINDASKVFDIIHPDDLLSVKESILKSAKELSLWSHEYRVRFEDNTIRWLLGNSMPELEEDGSILWHGFITDITDRKNKENYLRIAATAFESQEGIMITNEENIILRVNNAFSKITGYEPEEAIGKTPKLLYSGRQKKEFYKTMWDSINNTGIWSGEIINRRKNGELYTQYLLITAVKDDFGTVTNYVATLNDITLSKAAADEIKNLAFYDPLTKLPNRRLLLDRLQQALSTSTRNYQHGALLFIDLDHFKDLNDSLGHNTGDTLLQQVAERLNSCVRKGDTVARLGGDEFVLLLEGLNKDDIEAGIQTEVIGEKIINELNKPYKLNDYDYLNTASIGATLFYNNDSSIESLLKQADIAMYESKSAGRNKLSFFDPKMQEAITARLDIETELRKAIDQKQFQLFYQIQVDNYGFPIGAEALIRWQHPDRGLISPFHFIPLAEETGLIIPIGKFVLNAACSQLKLWEQNEFMNNLSLSVNVSAKQFNQVDFIDQVKEIITRYDINPKLLKLELTESMLVNDINDIINKMDELSKLGIQFSLDDFGTGYSSLQYLKRLPLNQLKIDQSFVRDISSDESDRAIVKTIITMAHGLGINVIAEGVETVSQKDFLLNNGCSHFQGYLFGKPVDIKEFEILCKSYYS
jgi:diguanylate cyclase (GGDEF)-like protein/PAS domain S-box-containing protein